LNIQPYLKAVVSLLVTLLYAVQAALSDGTITNTEWWGIAAGVLTSLGVYAVPNKPASNTYTPPGG
jgi:hypothetical protein